MNLKLQPSSPALPVQTSALIRQLDGLASDLRLPRERIENAFLDVGGKLGQCAAILGRISSVFEALPRDLESQELIEATQRLQAVGERAQLMAASFAHEQENIARLAQVVIAAERPIAELRRTVKMIGIVAINARVVAAGIVGELDDFAVFTTDIATLSASAAQTIADFSRVYRQLTAEVHKADAQRLHFEATHKDTLSGLADRLIANLGQVTRRRQESAEGGAETGRLSRQISSRIATAVSALQVGDMTRQRVEHVEAGLQTLQNILSGSDTEILGDAVALEGDWQSALIGAICSLQSQQLAGATEMFNREVVEAEDALIQLATDSKAVTDHSRQVYGNGDAEDQSPLATLNAELGRAALVLADCEAERGKLDRVAADVEATVRVLLGHVEAVGEIEANMRLVSLNAAVKCAQLGPRGTALNVIARQLRQLTGETVVSAQAAMSNLQEAGALAQSFHGASTGDKASGVRQLEEEATASMTLLSTVEKRLAGALAILRDDGPKAVELLGAAASGFFGHAEISQSIVDVQNRIEALMAENASAEGASVSSSQFAPVLQKLRKRYTMESERALHDQLFGAPPREVRPIEESAEPVLDAAAEDDLDAIFF